MNAVFESFPVAVHADLAPLLKNGSLQSHAVERITQQLGIDTLQLMTQLVPVAARLALPPISQFYVGAVIAAATSDSAAPSLYLGANIEFPGQSLIHSVHAEQAALTNARAQGATQLQAIAISAAPCGYCRQFLTEAAHQTDLTVVIAESEHAPARQLSLKQLLPEAFGPNDLGINGGLLSPELGRHDLHLAHPDKVNFDQVIEAALSAARQSYAPYTGAYAGCALELETGEIFSGSYGENAAYNPGVVSINAAVIQWAVQHGHVLAAQSDAALCSAADMAVKRAVLVEAEGATSQRGACEGVLAAIAPLVELEYVEVVLG